MGESTTGSILLVEDEPRVADFVTRSLVEAGYEVESRSTFDSALEAWRTRHDAIILDLMLPGGSGLELVKRARESGDRTPVLILSAKGSMNERIAGLDAGADDYLPKPFGIEELLARLRVLLRRASGNQPPMAKVDDLQIDFGTRRVTRRGRIIFLSETEYRLLELLATRLGVPVSKREILQYLWDDPDRDDNVVEVYISYVRTKLERGGLSRLIHTVRGQGYVLAQEDGA